MTDGETDFSPGVFAGVNVLVVEDDRDSREALTEFLDLCGLSVRCASSAAEALVAFRERRPDLVLSDINMPGGTGYDLVRTIRQLPLDEGGLTPAIAISGGTSEERSLEAGFHVHVRKPYDPVVLLDLIRDFIGHDEGQPPRWAVSANGDQIVLRWVGHVRAADMRAGVRALTRLLSRGGQYEVISDLKELTTFAPSVGSVAEREVWRVRHHISKVRVYGGPRLARIISKASCAVLGIPCELVD